MTRQKRDAKACKALGDNIKKYRELRGWSQSELADMAGVRPVSMYRYEAGRVMPGTEILGRIAAALGVPEGALLRAATPSGIARKRSSKAPREGHDIELGAEQQLQMFSQLSTAPAIRRAWAIHLASWGGAQKITRAYMVHFIEQAELEIAEGQTRFETIAERAGEYAFNAAVEAHARAQGHRQRDDRD